MQLKILGAAGEVTGSLYLLEAGASHVLVDCGTFQGRDEDRRNAETFPFDPIGVDAVLLTHAHLDHSGRIPLLAKRGFHGRIYATSPTVELCDVLWRDSTRLMKEEAEWRTRKNRRRGLPAVFPLYDEADVDQAIALFQPTTYDDVFDVAPGIRVRFRDAGHMLGSAMLEVWLKENDEEVKVVFSGDLGQQESVLERNPAVVEDAHFVVIESTYGDRRHKSCAETREEFASIMREALGDRSKVLIPTFVVERAQRVLYELFLLQEEGVLRDNVPIYLDSPMGVTATEIYRKYASLLSAELQGRLLKDEDPFAPKQLKKAITPQESRAINDVRHAVVLAGSGMANGGRIVHHLKHSLWDPKSHVIFVGYQAAGTLGRRIVEGEPYLRIAGEEVQVKSQVHTVGGFSSHADRDDLLAWASNFKTFPLFLVTHGEAKASESLASGLDGLGFKALAPVAGFTIALAPERREIPVVAAALKRGSDDARRALRDVNSLVASLLERLNDAEDLDDLLPLLMAAKTLLETANTKLLTR
ncbi:MAG: Metallo-beta-lactamase family protein [Synergistales bacterium 54_24]|nr:MAG: Metallo-beta-lactamase family protein [Synergistales bacterium 54_24]HAF51157.1 MBL fold hydrolase [Synergistaceae bacterium]